MVCRSSKEGGIRPAVAGDVAASTRIRHASSRMCTSCIFPRSPSSSAMSSATTASSADAMRVSFAEDNRPEPETLSPVVHDGQPSPEPRRPQRDPRIWNRIYMEAPAAFRQSEENARNSRSRQAAQAHRSTQRNVNQRNAPQQAQAERRKRKRCAPRRAGEAQNARRRSTNAAQAVPGAQAAQAAQPVRPRRRREAGQARPSNFLEGGGALPTALAPTTQLRYRRVQQQIQDCGTLQEVLKNASNCAQHDTGRQRQP